MMDETVITATRAGRARLSILAALAAVAPLAAALSADIGQRDRGGATLPAAGPFAPTQIILGPVAGLTEGWHVAPDRTAVPTGTLLTLQVVMTSGSHVRWRGAIEIDREPTRSTAVCPLEREGVFTIETEVEHDGKIVTDRAVFEVVPIPAESVRVTAIGVRTEALAIDESLSEAELNALTMRHYFGDSIAAVRRTGEDQYRTSIDHFIELKAATDPPQFAPLAEWRLNGEPVALGEEARIGLHEVGTHSISAGAEGRDREVSVDTYAVSIVSHEPGDLLPDGEPIVFVARTDPPGFESEITWLSSTKYGTATPVMGAGPVFIVKFDGTFGEDGHQWKGVKADQATQGQDQKLGLCCFGDKSDCLVVIEPECLEAGGLFTPGVLTCDFGPPEDPSSFALAGCGGLPACPAGSVTITRSRRNCCRLFRIGTPFDDTFFNGTVNTGAIPGANSVSITSFDVAENCTSGLAGAGAIKTYSCSLRSCTGATKVTVEVLNAAGAVICCESVMFAQ
jgi:hypothetical protein